MNAEQPETGFVRTIFENDTLTGNKHIATLQQRQQSKTNQKFVFLTRNLYLCATIFRRHAMSINNYPSVLLIYTCGPIGMIENEETGALEAFKFDQLLENVPELKRFHYSISSYQFTPPIDSSDMEPSLWSQLVKIIYQNNDKYDGFVILHGTDTMAYTASALSYMLEDLSKPVVLTCSQLPIGK